jgi:hypothetical protein
VATIEDLEIPTTTTKPTLAIPGLAGCHGAINETQPARSSQIPSTATACLGLTMKIRAEKDRSPRHSQELSGGKRGNVDERLQVLGEILAACLVAIYRRLSAQVRGGKQAFNGKSAWP